jgi:hypothetical protein
MTQRDPLRRLSVSDYLDVLQGKRELTVAQTEAADWSPSFPAYFDGFLYKLFLDLHWNGITPDARIYIICEVL